MEAAARFPDPSAAVDVGELITEAIEGALDERASDIHFDPQDDALVQRMRVDGVVQEVQRIPKRAGALADAPAEDAWRASSPPSGGCRRPAPSPCSSGGEQHHLRCTVIPTVHGEHVALRFVAADERPQPLPELGLAADAEETLAFALARTSGLVLVVGPPGSGKTTTAYAVLERLNTPTRILMTLEDPVERTLPDVDHIAVNGAGSPTFAQAQRAVLRAAPARAPDRRDPRPGDGARRGRGGAERRARDRDDARDRRGVVDRTLAELGVERDLIANAVHCVVAQRLVRTLCTQCREHYVADEDVRALVGGSAADAVPLHLYRSAAVRSASRRGSSDAPPSSR